MSVWRRPAQEVGFGFDVACGRQASISSDVSVLIRYSVVGAGFRSLASRMFSL